MTEFEENSSLATLRSGIDLEHRFKTVFRGYDKESVKAYLEEFQEEQRALTQDTAEQLDAMRAERETLMARVNELEAQAAVVREEERAKLAAESSVREGALATLRAENAKLVEENKQRQMQITELEERLGALGNSMVTSAGEFEALYDALGTLLQGKFNECNQLLEAAKKEHAEALEAARDRIATA